MASRCERTLCCSHGVKITSKKVTRRSFIPLSQMSTDADLSTTSDVCAILPPSSETVEVYIPESMPDFESLETEDLVRTHRWAQQSVIAINSISMINTVDEGLHKYTEAVGDGPKARRSLELPRENPIDPDDVTPKLRRRMSAEPSMQSRPYKSARTRTSLPSNLSAVQKWPTKKAKDQRPPTSKRSNARKDGPTASDSFALYRKWVYEGLYDILRKEAGCSCGLKSKTGSIIERHLVKKHQALYRDGGIKMFCSACGQFLDEVVNHQCAAGDNAQLLPGNCPKCDTSLINPYLSAHLNLKCQYHPS